MKPTPTTKVKVSERVLVVEDDEEICNYVVHELSTHWLVQTRAPTARGA